MSKNIEDKRYTYNEHVKEPFPRILHQIVFEQSTFAQRQRLYRRVPPLLLRMYTHADYREVDGEVERLSWIEPLDHTIHAIAQELMLPDAKKTVLFQKAAKERHMFRLQQEIAESMPEDINPVEFKPIVPQIFPNPDREGLRRTKAVKNHLNSPFFRRNKSGR